MTLCNISWCAFVCRGKVICGCASPSLTKNRSIFGCANGTPKCQVVWYLPRQAGFVGLQILDFRRKDPVGYTLYFKASLQIEFRFLSAWNLRTDSWRLDYILPAQRGWRHQILIQHQIPLQAVRNYWAAFPGTGAVGHFAVHVIWQVLSCVPSRLDNRRWQSPIFMSSSARAGFGSILETNLSSCRSKAMAGELLELLQKLHSTIEDDGDNLPMRSFSEETGFRWYDTLKSVNCDMRDKTARCVISMKATMITQQVGHGSHSTCKLFCQPLCLRISQGSLAWKKHFNMLDKWITMNMN